MKHDVEFLGPFLSSSNIITTASLAATARRQKFVRKRPFSTTFS